MTFGVISISGRKGDRAIGGRTVSMTAGDVVVALAGSYVDGAFQADAFQADVFDVGSQSEGTAVPTKPVRKGGAKNLDGRTGSANIAAGWQ